MSHSKGFTIVQVMVILLIVGIVLSVVVNAVIEKRCEDSPAAEVCVNRNAG